ncbi:hypothetical protein [Phytobacter sp. V91]|uniref:hypothetical protein n=1 Tax=Phytobacter sp. V91 TaxID=3369425 RepID=UPI003F629BDD
MKRIEVTIDICNLGETSIEDANNYAKHVAAAIDKEFSTADVSVKISESESSSIFVTGGDVDSTEDQTRVGEIINEVWEKWC